MNCAWKVDVLTNIPMMLIAPKQRISSGEHCCASIQSSNNSSLSNADGLLLQSFVNSDPVVGTHLVKLINACNPFIREHYRAGFQNHAASLFTQDCCSKTCSCCSSPRRV